MIWYGNKIIQTINKSLDAAAKEAAEFLADKICEALGEEPYPPESDPYEIPHYRSGDLGRSVGVARLALGEYQVGSNSPYAFFLELGTANMEPRPFFRPTINRYKKEAQAIVLEAARKNLRM